MQIVKRFVLNPSTIVPSLWPADKLTKQSTISDGYTSTDTYALQMNTFRLPGVDPITPEIQAMFKIENDCMVMSSDHCVLQGAPAIISDEKFIKSFSLVSLYLYPFPYHCPS